MKYREIIKQLKSLYNPEAVKGMARFGINPRNTFGVSIPNLRKIAKTAGKDHEIASQLWKSGIHEARLLAGFIDDPAAFFLFPFVLKIDLFPLSRSLSIFLGLSNSSVI